jgi:hypothetical protein
MNDSPKLPPDVKPIITKAPPPSKTNGKGDGVFDSNGKKRWKNRRRMAWTSLIMMISETIVLIYIAAFTTIDMSRLKTISEPLGWSYIGFMSIIGAYMGFTTWASKR